MYKICIIIYDYAPHSTGVWVLIYQAISSVTIVGKIQSHFKSLGSCSLFSMTKIILRPVPKSMG